MCAPRRVVRAEPEAYRVWAKRQPGGTLSHQAACNVTLSTSMQTHLQAFEHLTEQSNDCSPYTQGMYECMNAHFT